MTGRPWLLDLFCGAGGAAKGYWLAGFDVVGVDLVHQPHYPFSFQLGDALEVAKRILDAPASPIAAVHASPPCQRYCKLSSGTHGGRYEHDDLIGETRELLEASGLPYVIENVVGSPLRSPIELCGEMFGLQVLRHRRFESNVLLMQPEHKPHRGLVRGRENRGRPGAYYFGVWGHGGGDDGSVADWQQAMGIDWMPLRCELAEAIPPAFTEYVGGQLIEAVSQR